MTLGTVQQAIELGIAHERAGRFADAERVYRGILQQLPDEPMSLHRLGCVSLRFGHLQAAEQLIRRATQVGPNVAQRHNDLGVALQSLGRMDEAMDAFRTAVSMQPDLVQALNNLSACHGAAGEYGEAIALAQRATEIDPQFADAFNNLGNAMIWQGRTAEAVAAYRRAVALGPTAAQPHSNLLLVLHYRPEIEPAAMFAEHQAFGAKFAAPAKSKHPNRRDPHRRLRIGYVSPDFRQHSVGYFVEAAIEKHDRNAFEVFCYSDVIEPDAMTQRIQSCASAWRVVNGLPHDAVERLIRQDQIDILVDLAGHSARNRLPVFARKPAPVQVTYLGYPDTTGLGAMDYRITDSLADPPGESERFGVEKLHRIDPCAWCFRPHEPHPPLPPSPRIANRPITFGTFNAVAKLNDPLIGTWAQILRAIPESRFFMKAAGLARADVADPIRRKFESCGIPLDRLDFIGQHIDATQHLALYERIDIALDTFPYHGTTTTCEAMWMGVPVVTLVGRAHAGRVGVSLLSSMRLEELIASNPEAYVQIAVDLARDPQRLAALSKSLRQRMLASPLMNGYAFTRRLEAAYRSMWGHWCSPGVQR